MGQFLKLKKIVIPSSIKARKSSDQIKKIRVAKFNKP